jgi:hypothetical protein
MMPKYIIGSIISNIYRFLHIYPNSDPIIGFVVPAAKNEKWWKAPAFAFTTMAVFDYFTSGIGVWTIVTSTTYAAIALILHLEMKGKKSGLKLFASRGAIGILLFDAITGPGMSTIIFKQDFFTTTIMQIPFTIMHLISGIFAITIISPFLDPQVSKEINAAISNLKNQIYTPRPET